MHPDLKKLLIEVILSHPRSKDLFNAILDQGEEEEKAAIKILEYFLAVKD